MEEILLRFLHLGDSIFESLDNKSLVNCKKVSRLWNNFNKDKEWIRILIKHDEKNYNNYTHPTSKSMELYSKLPIKDVKKIVTRLSLSGCGNTSLHIASEKGDIKIFNIILETQEFKNPKNYAG